MDHRIPLSPHTLLPFAGMPCHIEGVVGQGSNAIVYKGWYPDSLDPRLHHHVLIKELFPFHPQGKIWRGEDGAILVSPEGAELWQTHRESFEIGNNIHLRLLADHPDRMALGGNFNSFSLNGTLYSVLGYTGGRSLQAELNRSGDPLRHTAQRMIGLLDALEAFHKSGYLHLDISPDNIMLVGQGEQERIFLIDYNSAREIGSRDGGYLSRKAGFSPPELESGNWSALNFSSDLYCVAAVFFRCIMGRSLTLPETLQPKPPDGQDSALLKDMPQTVRHMVSRILRQGLHTLPRRRYQSIGGMRQAFQELIDRIDCVGVTHWALWENGQRSVAELVRINPSLRYLQNGAELYPIRLEGKTGMTLERYLEALLSPAGKSAIVLGQGGIGKTTLLLHTAMLRGKQYSPAAPAVFYLPLGGWEKGDTHFIRRQMLMRLRFKPEENTFDSAMHTLQLLLEQPLETKQGPVPAVLLLLDGLNEVQGEIGPLVEEINHLAGLAGVRILATSRSEIPELALENFRLMPLNVEDVEQTLGKAGLLIPREPQVVHLLRTPLILSIFIQTSETGVQPDVQNEEELMKAYLASLLEKELRQLPEDSPQRWQIDVALNFVLPAIAIEAKRIPLPMTQQRMLRVVTVCWKTLDARNFRKQFPNWIGHSRDIRGDAKTAEEWFGGMVYQLLWQRLGMLTKDTAGNYNIYHQTLGEYLAKTKLPTAQAPIWGLGIMILLLSAVLGAGYQQHLEQAAAEETVKTALELSATGYVKYGLLYGQLQKLTEFACQLDAEGFDRYYSSTLESLQSEQERTKSEQFDATRMEQSSAYDRLRLRWGDDNSVYQYEFASELLTYPDERAALYAEMLPALKAWMLSEALQEKAPDFAEYFSALLEADADLAAKTYDTAVAICLPNGGEAWAENIQKSVAEAHILDPHRDSTQEDVYGAKARYLETLGEFNRQYSYLRNYMDHFGMSE